MSAVYRHRTVSRLAQIQEGERCENDDCAGIKREGTASPGCAPGHDERDCGQ
jgi:hypothetical protein